MKKIVTLAQNLNDAEQIKKMMAELYGVSECHISINETVLEDNVHEHQYLDLEQLMFDKEQKDEFPWVIYNNLCR